MFVLFKFCYKVWSFSFYKLIDGLKYFLLFCTRVWHNGLKNVARRHSPGHRHAVETDPVLVTVIYWPGDMVKQHIVNLQYFCEQFICLRCLTRKKTTFFLIQFYGNSKEKIFRLHLIFPIWKWRMYFVYLCIHVAADKSLSQRKSLDLPSEWKNWNLDYVAIKG